MSDGIVNSCTHQNVVARSATAVVDDQRGIAEMAIDLQISQIHEGTCQSGIPDSEATRFAEPLDGNNRCFGCYSVESRRQRRIHEIVPKTENDAGHRNSVPASISLPCLRLARNRSSFSAPAAKTSSKLHRDPLLGEISSPGKRQSAVDDADVDSLTIITNDARRSRAEVGHVHCVQVPIVCASGKVALRIVLRVRICSGYVRERLNGGKLGSMCTQCNSIDLRNDVQHFPVRTKILKVTVRYRLIEEDVNPDHLILCLRPGCTKSQ